MKMTFRWYGERDLIPLEYIRQIPNMSGVVTAVYDCPVGGRWSAASVNGLKARAAGAGLEMCVIESVPVHEDIKLGKPSRDGYIDNYIVNIKTLADAGVQCICYNFMPVFDWLRTDLKAPAADGSNSLLFDDAEMRRLDPKSLSLPGWDESYTKEELNGLLGEYRSVSHGKLFENLVYFLNKIMPVCGETGVDMAIHPDDPPWDIFGLPRIIADESDLDRLFATVPDKHNGLTFCSGSLGAGRFNDLVKLAGKYAGAGRIKFAHLRNI
ncbi:MAG: mannonate dehydratase, partial [Clostridiales bacterium]|nr:mannonate dehydratase [Clostridiales bacterium]